jgi:hypothetical protein
VDPTLAVIPLRKSRYRRVLAGVGGMLLIPVAFLWALIVIYAGDGSASVFAVVLLSVPWLAGTLWGIGLLIKALSRSELRVESDRLVLVDRLNAAGPIEVARDDIESIALDDGSGATAANRLRFPIERPGRLAEFLWQRRKPSVFRRVGDAGPAPNMALLLKRPLSFQGGRRVLWSYTADSPPVKRGEPVTGLLVAAGDLEAARLALPGWPITETGAGVVDRPLGVRELGPAPFGARPLQYARWKRALGVLAMICVGVVIGFGRAGKFEHAAFTLAATLPVLVPAYLIASRGRRAHAEASRRAAAELRSLAPDMTALQRANALAEFKRDYGEADPEHRRLKRLLNELDCRDQRTAA